MISNNKKLIALRTGQKQAEHSGEYWSEHDRSKLYQLFYEGYGISEIAITMERTERGVFNQLDRAGLLAPQAKSRGRRTSNYGTQCLCPDCNVITCQNCGKECGYAGNV